MPARRRPAKASPALLLLLLTLLLTAATVLPQAAAAAPVMAYRGLGTWFDMYDYSSAWKDPETAAAKLAADMKAHGVRTLFLETANYHLPQGSETVYRRDAVGPIIEQCHAQGIKVVAWYLPGFEDMAKDRARSEAAIDFRSAGGQKFDSFTLDIEATTVKPATLRTERLLTLSRKIRSKVGSKYPLGACIMSPAGMTKSPSIWPGFPYAGLAAIYDVFVPMGYYTYHGDGYANAYRDTSDNIRIIREQTGLPSVPIHVIGGEGSKSSAAETRAYVRALRENGILGGSMYDITTTSDASWAILKNVPNNPRQATVLPVTLPSSLRLGYLSADRTHPKEVFYQTTGLDGDRLLRFRLYDVQADEVRLLVNWKDLGPLARGPVRAWTAVRTVAIPSTLLKPGAANVIGFVARGVYPAWHRWGVRDVSLDVP